MTKIYDMPHQIAYYECDMTGKLSIPMIFSIVNLASNKQSEELGVGDAFVHELGLGWIILQYHIEIKRRPAVDENVILRTLAREFNPYFANRDFLILDQAGNELVVVHALFSLLDMEKRKITKIPNEMVQGFEPELVKRVRHGGKPTPIVETDHIWYEQDYLVRYTDIDFNQHVNNSRYFDWMIDVLGADFLNQHEARYINIRFEKEVGRNDLVTSQVVVNEEGTNTKHRILFEGGKLSADANIDWAVV